jgi:hypothetical protein
MTGVMDWAGDRRGFTETGSEENLTANIVSNDAEDFNFDSRLGGCLVNLGSSD